MSILRKLLKIIPLILSLCLGLSLVFLSENSDEVLNNLAKTQNVEHTILLDLTSKADKIIYDNLVYSNYFCSTLNPKQVQCTQFKANEPLVSTAQEKELYQYTSNTGKALRVYQTKNGVAHLELKDHDQSTLHRYSFTSVEKVFSFTSQHKGLFRTDESEWDVSSLDYIL